jgi:maltokinase
MVSGCAIMVLVGVTGIGVQSYGTDTRLLDELRGSWPVEGVSSPRADGFLSTDPAGLEIAGAVRLTDRFGVALAVEPGNSFAVVPTARDEYGGWRRARPGDGLSAFVAGVPEASERPIGVDQTHESVIVGERAILKWFRRVGPGRSRASLLIAHLAEVGFDGIPAPLGSLAWRSLSGVELTIAQGDAFLPDARDGWEWVVDRCEGRYASVGRELGELVAGLHQALAVPSSVIERPVGSADRETVGRWKAEALSTLDEAIALTEDPELATWAPAMRSVLEAVDARSAPIQPVHGDLHVGQVLEWPGGLAVIDFDGNPTLSEAGNAISQPRERDVAQLVTSLDHVGRVVENRGVGDRATWIAEARDGFLSAVGQVDKGLLAALEVEQECRELVYAARFLPRWTYAPMATLRARFG